MTGSKPLSRDELRTRLRLYAITPDRPAGTQAMQALLHEVQQALLGGVTILQYRDKSTRGPAERLELAQALRALTHAADVLFVVNDDLELALAVQADGVHVGPHDESVASLRLRVPAGFLIGGSAGNPTRGSQLVHEGADYLGVGAIFDAHGTKPDASAPQGPELLQSFRSIPALAAVPIVAIGGITQDNAALCLQAGADGVAVSRALFGASSPRDASRAFLV